MASEYSTGSPRYLVELLQCGTMTGLHDGELARAICRPADADDATAELAFATLLRGMEKW